MQQKIGERCRGATPLSLGKMQGQGSAAKNMRALPLGGYPAIFGKNAGARQCSKKIGERYRWGATPLWEKCRGKAVQQKLASATAGGATPLSLGKLQGQGSAAKNWSALLGKCQGQGSAVKKWRALPLGATLYLWENARAGQCSKRLASAAGGLPHYLWEKCRGRAVQQKLASAAGGLPLYLAGAGQCSKNLASATAKGDPCIFRKNIKALIPNTIG